MWEEWHGITELGLEQILVTLSKATDAKEKERKKGERGKNERGDKRRERKWGAEHRYREQKFLPRNSCN